MNLFDPDGEDPIPDNFISGEEFIAQFYEIEQEMENWSVLGAISVWNDQPFGVKDLYLAVDSSKNFNKLNTLDVKHFMKVLEIAYIDKVASEMTLLGPLLTTGSADAYTVGIANEFRHLFSAPGSFMDAEDPSSNMAGIDLSLKLEGNMAFATQLRLYFDAIGIIQYQNGNYHKHISWIQNLIDTGESFSEY